MNTPPATCKSMTEILSAVSQIIIFSLGRKNSIDTPFIFTRNVKRKSPTALLMRENFDPGVSSIIAKGETLEAGVNTLWQHLLRLAPNVVVKIEILQLNQLTLNYCDCSK